MARIEGRLATWNDDRGFDFIEPTQGVDEVFVHVSALPRDGRRPMNGETLLFDVQTDAQGRCIVGAAPSPQYALCNATIAALIAARAPLPQGAAPQITAHTGAAPTKNPREAPPWRHGFGSDASVKRRCDGRQHCSQMTSCDEATFFIKNGPDTKMGGDRDGVPCEEQRCSF